MVDGVGPTSKRLNIGWLVGYLTGVLLSTSVLTSDVFFLYRSSFPKNLACCYMSNDDGICVLYWLAS
ncbi:hypothetical protein HanIR_Chr08g0390041 [Helianthus annuus]|nr:hypothetical protein HanIR_Chr08g0390041 [Helianthus annuus]